MYSSTESYARRIERFVELGASLIRQTPLARYGRLAPTSTRHLEPGFAPPDVPARVVIVSSYPNAAELHGPGSAADTDRRALYAAWGTRGDAMSYRLAYYDWLTNLERMPFHHRRTRPILSDVGLRNDEIAWLPLVKLPMSAGSNPGEAFVDIDLDDTWKQLRLLQPEIIWIQGIAIERRVRALVAERLTDRILPAQSVSRFDTADRIKRERATIGTCLRAYLASSRSGCPR